MRILRLLHRWIGLALALPMLAQAATGFLMLMSPPVDDLSRPAAVATRVSPSPLSTVIAATRKGAPAGLVPLRYRSDGTGVASVDFARPSQRVSQIRVYVDPVSLMVLGGDDHPDRVYRWLHRIHETFLFPGPFGRTVVGWCGLGLIVLAVTGVPIWWPRQGWWRAALTVPAKARGYRLYRGLHGATGWWVVALLLLQALSGTTMTFPGGAARLLGVTPTRLPSAGRGAPPDIDLDRVAAALQAAEPGARLVSLRFPTEPGLPMIASLQSHTIVEGPPTVVFVEPVTQRVLAIRDPRAGSTGAALLAWLRTLHEGAGLGPVWRLVIGMTGLALTLFPVTGFAMWFLRGRANRRRRAQQALLQGAGK
jgi:uncharacterized iron-regulated membrane protein